MVVDKTHPYERTFPMKPTLLGLTLLLCTAISVDAAIVDVFQYRLGEPGTLLGANNLPQDSSGNGYHETNTHGGGSTSVQTSSPPLTRTWKPRTTQPPGIAEVVAMTRVWYWLQMACYVQLADDLLLVGRGSGGCLEAAFRMAFDDYGRTRYSREAFQNIAKTG